MVCRNPPQASLEAWQAEARATLKRLVFSPVQKATLGTSRARQKVPLGLHWQGDVVFRKRPQASVEAWQVEPRATLKKLVFSSVQKATLGSSRAGQKVPLGTSCFTHCPFLNQAKVGVLCIVRLSTSRENSGHHLCIFK